MSGADIKAKGIAQANRKLEQIVSRVSNLQPAMVAGAAAVATLIDDSFHSGRSPSGELFEPHSAATLAKWAPLQKSTLKRRRAENRRRQEASGALGLGSRFAPELVPVNTRGRAGFHKILVDTARLRNSITTEATLDAIKFGTNVEYAGAHQFGTTSAGKGNSVTIPQRPFLPIEKVGGGYRVTDRGPAARTLDAIKQYVMRYISTGRVR